MEGPGVSSTGSGYCQVGGFYEYGNKPSIYKEKSERISRKTEENFVFRKNECAP